MKLSGHTIRRAIRRWDGKRKTYLSRWNESMWRFEGDPEKMLPKELMDKFKQASYAVVALQDLQQRLNHSVKCKMPDGTELSLSMVVKLLGDAGLEPKMWRGAAHTTPGKRRYRYSSDEVETTRNKDEIRAVKQITAAEADKLADAADLYYADLNDALAFGNSADIEVTDAKLISILEEEQSASKV